MNYQKMDPEMKVLWLAALRSGKYDQTTAFLKGSTGGYCCLGVLCDVIDPSKWVGTNKRGYLGHDNYDPEYKSLPTILRAKFKIQNEAVGYLTTANDTGHTFLEIADWIEQNL